MGERLGGSPMVPPTLATVIGNATHSIMVTEAREVKLRNVVSPPTHTLGDAMPKTNENGFIMPPELDERDAEILAERTKAREAREGIRVGDYVRFADGTERRVSYIWEYDGAVQSVQTSNGGSYHLGETGGLSMSGSMFMGIKPDTLTLTDELKDGSAWFFHHNHWQANNGVYVTIPNRVFTCSLTAAKV